MQEFDLSHYDVSYAYLVDASSLPYLSDSTEEENYFKEKERICVVAYNLGLKAMNERRHDGAIQWLVFGCEYGKNIKAIPKTFLVRVS